MDWEVFYRQRMWQICWENLDQDSLEKVHLPASLPHFFRQSVHCSTLRVLPINLNCLCLLCEVIPFMCHGDVIPPKKMINQAEKMVSSIFLGGGTSWKTNLIHPVFPSPPKPCPPRVPICRASSGFLEHLGDVSSYPTSPPHPPQAAIFFHLAKFCSFKPQNER